ncbi:MAG: ABC transporter ATP-binding protein [Eubacteriales bacterium]|nr:ABC transporter ATP-binding protein [Eubacteriales bacterium]
MIEVRNLEVCFTRDHKDYIAVTDSSFTVQSGEILGIVGESGCGKSISSLAIMGLLPPTARVTKGSMRINDQEITDFSPKALAPLRGSTLSMIFQEPMTALNPLIPVGKQVQEVYETHHHASKKEAYEKTLDMMRKVGLSRVEKLYKDYPHQLSGGMRQRIVIAIALINKPEIVIADEPTTALDVTIQAQILDLLKKLNEEDHTSALFISHDLGIIRTLCSRAVIMYAGYIVEEGAVADLFQHPLHPYTRGLLDSIPTSGKKGKPLYSIEGIVPPLFARDHTGCCFKDRCTHRCDICNTQTPALTEVDGRKVRCHFPLEVKA